MSIRQMTFFFGAENALSNWHPAVFVCKGITFNNSEQFMMYCKAKLFQDHDTAQRILQAKTPKEQKALGRQVRNFNQDIWDKHCEATGDSELVEASPYDRIWGVGLTASDPRIQDKTQWQGQFGRIRS